MGSVLHQHVLMEQLHYRIKMVQQQDDDTKAGLIKTFKQYSFKLKQEIHKLTDIIETGLDNGVIAKQQAEHRALLQAFSRFESARDKFHVNAMEVLTASNSGIPDQDWVILEKQDEYLDAQSVTILREIESITADLAGIAQRHEERFFYVNTGLGISAFAIGINLTIFIILSFRNRMTQLNEQVNRLHQSISKQEAIPGLKELGNEGKDELAKLAKDINRVISRYSEALDRQGNIEETLVKQATTDSLTGAYNRHKWQESIKSSLKKVSVGQSASIVMFDVDNFKTINDQHGHAVGDSVLQTLVKEVYLLVRQSDQVFRIGGEEFILLLPDCAQEKAAEIANKICKMLSSAKRSDMPNFSASFGVAEIYSSDNEATIMERVDKAMYQAKNGGKNQVVVA